MVTGQVGPSGILSDVLTVTIELSNDQFKSLPSDPAIIVPATEVLNYSGFPSQIPLIASATVVLNNVAGAYVADPAAYLVIAMGSDWSSDLTQKCVPNMLTNPGLHVCSFASKMLANVASTPSTSFIEADSLVELNDSVLDNSIVLAASNEGAGDFTGGNEANRAWIVLTYQLLEVT